MNIECKTLSFHNKYENSKWNYQQTCYLRNFNGRYQDWHDKIWRLPRFCHNQKPALTTLQQNEHVTKYSNSILTCNNIFVVGRGLNTIPQWCCISCVKAQYTRWLNAKHRSNDVEVCAHMKRCDGWDWIEAYFEKKWKWKMW